MDAPKASETMLDTLRLRLRKIDKRDKGGIRSPLDDDEEGEEDDGRRQSSTVFAEAQPQLVLLTSPNTSKTKPAVRVTAPGMSNPPVLVFREGRREDENAG